jgi:hypothetical protein
VRSKLSFNSEPALWIGLLGSVFSLALAFGLRLTVDQQGAIIAVTIGVLALTTRQSVVPAYRRDSVAVPVVPAAPVVVLCRAAIRPLQPVSDSWRHRWA